MLYKDIHTHRSTPGDVVRYSAGIHPLELDQADKQLADIALLARYGKIAALGECGLDARSPYPEQEQRRVLRAQIALAEQYALPLLLHCVKRTDELLALHKQYRPRQPWIWHGFRGNIAVAKQVQREGIYLSVSEHFNTDAVKGMDRSLLLIESDTSELPIDCLYARVAQAMAINRLDLLKIINTNWQQIFRK